NQTRMCMSWPNTKSFNLRRIFCETHDGFKDLCNCENPFTLSNQTKESFMNMNPKPLHWKEDIPILIITGNRTRYMFRLLQSLVHQDGVRSDLITLVMDGEQIEAAKIADILGLRIIIH
ncbi:unnamed protein product, partial [Meganyctiphanes norvegica]